MLKPYVGKLLLQDLLYDVEYLTCDLAVWKENNSRTIMCYTTNTLKLGNSMYLEYQTNVINSGTNNDQN